jgi:hypothetical protein
MGRLLSEELVLYHCQSIVSEVIPLWADAYILVIVWEVLALCLTAWIVVKHLRGLRRSPSGSAIGG